MKELNLCCKLKIAVFSDIHGNAINLEHFFKVTNSLNIDQYICLGDLCNYYPDAERVVMMLQNKGCVCLLGNHDQMYLRSTDISELKKIAYCYNDDLNKNQNFIDYLKNLSITHQLLIQNKKIFFCHGSPFDPLDEYVYPNSDLKRFDELNLDVVFMGNTHRQFLKKLNNKLYCNVGSVGQPRDKGNMFGFAVFDTEKWEILLYRVLSNTKSIFDHYKNSTTKEVLQLLSRNEEINFEYTLLK